MYAYRMVVSMLLLNTITRATELSEVLNILVRGRVHTRLFKD